MPDVIATPPTWLAEELARQLKGVLESMSGQACEVGFGPSELTGRQDESDPECLWWEQAFTLGPEQRIWIEAPAATWREIGKIVLDSADPSENDEETLRDTYLEILRQAFAGLAVTLSEKIGRETSAVEGHPAKPVESAGQGSNSFEIKMGAASLSLQAIFSGGWRESAPEPRPNQALVTAPAKPNTIDLLLDVELPVSISFGRTQLPLKDVIKLTTGSIVELNRSVTEPVEVIVNNCVIARAEVVVVEGNFGVRIKQVVSRQERLRTLN